MLNTPTLPVVSSLPAKPPLPQERSSHLPQAHLLLEEIGELLLPLGAVVLVLSALAFVVPAGDVGQSAAVQPKGEFKGREPSCLSKP